jgi:hypothetical protein
MMHATRMNARRVKAKLRSARTTQGVKQCIGVRKFISEDASVHEYDELKSSKGYDGLKSPKR